MAITNYGDLKDKVRALSNRSTVLDAQMDVFTTSFESWVWRNIRVPQMITNNGTDTATSRFTNLPTGFLEMIRLSMDEGGKRVLLEPVTPERAAAQDPSMPGTPRMYSITGNQLELIPVPSSASLHLVYYYKLGTLTSSDSTTNAILDNYPDLYLYGVLLESAVFMQDDKRMRVYGTKLSDIREEIKRFHNRYRIGAGVARSYPL